jgi:hypothetical protein
MGAKKSYVAPFSRSAFTPERRGECLPLGVYNMVKMMMPTKSIFYKSVRQDFVGAKSSDF